MLLSPLLCVQVLQNVVWHVGDQAFYWNVQPGGDVPLVRDAAPTVVRGNLFVKDTLDADAQAPWVDSTPGNVDWKGYTPSTFSQNVVASLVPAGAPRRPALLGGKSCGSIFGTNNSTCSRSFLDNFNASVFDFNLYYNLTDTDPAGGGTRFPGASGKASLSLAAWRELGHDVHSAYGDPLFVDAARRDYRLRPDSPAVALGFEQWDWSKAGPDW